MNHPPPAASSKLPVLRYPLVLVSSRIDPQLRAEVAAGRSPRRDFLALADALGADILDTAASQHLPRWQRQVENALASDVAQARVAWQRRGAVSAWLSTSEKVGLPLALLGCVDVPHILIVHNLMSRRKQWLEKVTGVLRKSFDAIICLSAIQEAFLRDVVNLPPERIYRVFDNVDTEFWRPSGVLCHSAYGESGYLLAVGRENRDYPTLIEAARRLNLPLTIVSSSLWTSRGRNIDANNLPPNVTVLQDFVPYAELRMLYENARLVVVPLRECNYAAGVNGVMEAMAMGKATVVTCTEGLQEYLQDRVANWVVPSGNPDALADALRALWADQNACRALGAAGRARVEREMSLDIYVARIAEIVKASIPKGSRL